MDHIEEDVEKLEKKTTGQGFWDDNKQAQDVLQQLSQLKEKLKKFNEVKEQETEVAVLIELSGEAEDGELDDDLEQAISIFRQKVEALELESMLDGKDDARNALLTIHAGAGGTEAQDWAEMLLRMYTRWLERRHFQFKIIDRQMGDEAGIKSAVLEVEGRYAYGYLKAESGVHRLIRLSPFDANHRRHTSCASVFIYPEIDDDIEIEIDPKDMRIDT
ncbi:MAG TPA: PCRF domain-containing protein [Bacteroidetes bacterium]|nr:PCRF domain-containing protein [Bacteroidota bacterium]